MILVDTSIWIEVFRARASFTLEQHVAFDDVVTCLPIVQEILQGFKDEADYRRARDAMFAMPMLESPLRSVLFEDAARLYRSVRRRGKTVRSSMDCLIAACAIRYDVEILHRDRDFPTLAEVAPLRERSV